MVERERGAQAGFVPRFEPTLLALAAALVVAAPGCRGDRTPSVSDDESTDDGASTEGSAGSDEAGADDESTGDDSPAAADYELLTPTQHLVRVSMALRGTRPSVADLDRVQDDPDAIGELVDAYLDSDEFREVLRDLHNDALLVDAEIFELDSVGPLADEPASRIAESVLQGPLRLIEHVVMEDRPYTEIVTGDTWMVDARSSVVWGTDYDESGPMWQEVSPPDDRPPAGILSDNAVYMRHESCGFNFNRGRAHLVANALLCHDFLAADIDIDGSIDLSDPEAVATAVQTVGACMGCHQTLDPLASTMNGYFETAFPDSPYTYPLPSMYDGDFLEYWPEITGRSPAFFSKPVDDMSGVGQAIADDPRFSRCTAQRFYGYFAQQPAEDIPHDVAAELQLVLEDSDFSARALVRHIVLSDDFRRASVPEDSTADPDELVGYKRARPFQLSNVIEDLTGYEWVFDLSAIEDQGPPDSQSAARSAFLGFEVLAGGHDSFFQKTPTRTVNTTTVLFMRRLAVSAASYVVDQDFAVPASERRLLPLVEPDDSARGQIEDQLVWLFRRIHGESLGADDEAIVDAYAIFEAVHARTDDPAQAWKATLSALLSDLNVVYY